MVVLFFAHCVWLFPLIAAGRANRENNWVQLSESTIAATMTDANEPTKNPTCVEKKGAESESSKNWYFLFSLLLSGNWVVYPPRHFSAVLDSELIVKLWKSWSLESSERAFSVLSFDLFIGNWLSDTTWCTHMIVTNGSYFHHPKMYPQMDSHPHTEMCGITLCLC